MTELRRLLRDACRTGEGDVERYRSNPQSLPALRLSRFEDSSVRGVLLRRILLALRIPAGWYGALMLSPSPVGDNRELRKLLAALAYWQGVRRAATRDLWWRLLRPPVILMYHSVGGRGETASRYILPVRTFVRQMRWLRRMQCNVMSLDALVALRRAGQLPPPRSVVLTFDDGYRDNAEVAAPILRDMKYPATIFIVTAMTGTANTWDAVGELAGRPLLSWDEMCALQSVFGLSFGGHTRRHTLLAGADAEDLANELRSTYADLERELGDGPRTFAYPRGRFDAHATAAVEDAGFTAACCSLGGTNEPWVPLYELRRVEVKGTDKMAQFVLSVRLGRRIAPAQLLRKIVCGE